MTKPPEPNPRKCHTEDAMRRALARFAALRDHLNLLRDDDDPVALLEDAIEEVLQRRQTMQELQSYMQMQVLKMARQ